MEKRRKVNKRYCCVCGHFMKYCDGDIFEPCTWHNVTITTKKRDVKDDEERATDGPDRLLQKT